MIRELQAYMTRPWPFSKRSHLEDLWKTVVRTGQTVSGLGTEVATYRIGTYVRCVTGELT
jgi:hypothetical protein